MKRVLIAVSSGQDSVTLSAAFIELLQRRHIRVLMTLAHCNHGWTGDSMGAAHVVRLASLFDGSSKIIVELCLGEKTEEFRFMPRLPSLRPNAATSSLLNVRLYLVVFVSRNMTVVLPI